MPFKFNRVQDQLYEGLSSRSIVLKARQFGVTSLIMGLFLVDCITRPNTTSVVIAHEEFITQRLLEKAKVFEASIPDVLKPTMHHRSSYELSWEDIHSTFYIGSARSFVFGRGERIDNALCSEIAFWLNPEKIMVPLNESVPISGKLILESTPNGEGNFFHEKWQEASQGWSRGTSVYRPFFFPWWMDMEYSLGIEGGLQADAVSPLAYTEEELKLGGRFNLTENQIRWRRYKKNSLGGMFSQEYPEDDQTCFLQVREAVFDIQLINNKLLDCYPAPDVIDGVHVWVKPEEGHTYIIGADPTVGLHDKAAATVWDLLGLRLCARLTGLLEPHIFADKLKALGLMYNKALLVVENNNPGVAVLGYLMDYTNLYMMRDIITGRPTGRAGWTTSRQTKSYMIQEFKKCLPGLIIPDIELLREAKNFRYLGLDVDIVGEDDLMMSAMLALVARDQTPAVDAFQGTWGWQKF